jgi:hypothetical protein
MMTYEIYLMDECHGRSHLCYAEAGSAIAAIEHGRQADMEIEGSTKRVDTRDWPAERYDGGAMLVPPADSEWHNRLSVCCDEPEDEDLD